MAFEDLLNPELFDQMEKQMEDPQFQFLMQLQEILIEYDAAHRTLQKRFVTQFETAITEFTRSSKSSSSQP